MSIYCVACHQIEGSGNIVTEDRTNGSFTGVEAGGAFEVELQNGTTTSVKVEADDNIIKDIETKIDGNILKISVRRGIHLNGGHFKAFITAPEIGYINMSGAATANIKGILKNTNKIKLESSGASGINGELEAPEMETDASGASTIDISGRTKNYNATASGSAGTHAFKLMSETTTASASGAANLNVFSSVSLNADASGASAIEYKGGGTTQIKVSGSANIRKED